ncbi:MAG TPA: hypothetical protein VET82_09615 [Candidatus Eisenbacteria bacterium]|nr:hypothetical protein [Candidatus Eisenbacteria bacterium]
MQATYELKPFPFQIVAIVCGLLAVAIIGAAGGYWLKGFDHPGSAAAATVTADRPTSMVGENAQQSTAAGSVGQASVVGENAVADATIPQQASLVGENGQVLPTPEKLRDSHRR